MAARSNAFAKSNACCQGPWRRALPQTPAPAACCQNGIMTAHRFSPAPNQRGNLLVDHLLDTLAAKERTNQAPLYPFYSDTALG
jgi:hypothetical protein